MINLPLQPTVISMQTEFASLIVIGIIGFIIFVIIAAIRGASSIAAERAELGIEKKFLRLEKEEGKELATEAGLERQEALYERAESNYERQIYSYLGQVRNALIYARNYATTSPIAARRYAASFAPYVNNVIKMLQSLLTSEKAEEKIQKKEEKNVKKTKKTEKRELGLARRLLKIIRREEKLTLRGR